MAGILIKGRVILAAAGPGDPDLLTIKAARFLQQADVVLTDRLVSNAILDTYVRKDAEIIYVGKQFGHAGSTPQETINDLLVYYAGRVKLVVRLKGGDVSVFSNILDELQTLVKHNISYEIVPGVTAALGAAAYAGIPLTARGYSTGVRFLTSYKSDIVPETYWRELAATSDTLVFYMSSETLPALIENLTFQNISHDVMLAVVEQATTPNQKVHCCNIYNYRDDFAGKDFISPALVIIGKVVALHEQFNWLTNTSFNEQYFPPVSNVVEQVKLSA